MRIIALEQECRSLQPAKAGSVLKAEAEALWGLLQEGLVREAHFRADRKEAVLILEARDPHEAEEALARLPLVSGGYIRFELIPLTPYDGFARLFAPHEGGLP
jgi:hypothetical protein